MLLPASLKARIARTWGQVGSDWIDRFLETLREVCDCWQLSNLRPFSNLSYHFVAAANWGEREIVLKMGVPHPEFFAEAKALKALSGKSCVAILDESPDLAALILERAIPGNSLEESWSPEHDDECTAQIANAMPKLWRCETLGEFPILRDWTRGMEKANEIPAELRRCAMECLSDLEGNNDPILLHGDLHHGNILKNGEGFKVIDPKGVIGDPAFEVYALLRNPTCAPNDFCLSNWRRRLEIVSAITGLDGPRLVRGALLGTVISCLWSVQEGGVAPSVDLALANELQAAIC